MITVEEAEHILNTHPGTWGTEPIPLTHAAGRVLAEPVYADRDLPPFPRATMDGIAINYTDWNAGIKEYNIIGTQAAGMPPLSLSVAGDAVEIMTGATLPHTPPL